VPARSAAAIRAHIEFLADDLLEGRVAGSHGYDRMQKISSGRASVRTALRDSPTVQ
jgi:hypothetical protein